MHYRPGIFVQTLLDISAIFHCQSPCKFCCLPESNIRNKPEDGTLQISRHKFFEFLQHIFILYNLQVLLLSCYFGNRCRPNFKAFYYDNFNIL